MNNIKLYTKKDCPACDIAKGIVERVKEKLDDKKVSVEIVDIEKENTDVVNLLRAEGVRTVPVMRWAHPSDGTRNITMTNIKTNKAVLDFADLANSYMD